ncbi:MAG: hypothetical protein A3K76_06105 [Euryarchaeota archaeon RBG_13_57_23]|nr:MAG: hypothetical protein A3K76_06105 [Euryarchaeota archaeon RBG_13_57_23]
MGKTYKSELARRISTGRGRASPFETKFLVLSVAVCAILAFGAATVFGAAAKPAYAGPVEYTEILSGTNYLVYQTDELTGEVNVVHSDAYTMDFAAKREMTVKEGAFISPGNPDLKWQKVVYTVNLRLRDLAFEDPDMNVLASIEPIGMIVGQLDIGYGPALLGEISASFMVNGCEPLFADGSKADAVDVVIGEARTLVTVTLPDLTGTQLVGYAEGDFISVNVILKGIFVDGAALDPVETAFPAFDDIVLPETTV